MHSTIIISRDWNRSFAKKYSYSENNPEQLFYYKLIFCWIPVIYSKKGFLWVPDVLPLLRHTTKKTYIHRELAELQPASKLLSAILYDFWLAVALWRRPSAFSGRTVVYVLGIFQYQPKNGFTASRTRLFSSIFAKFFTIIFKVLQDLRCTLKNHK